MICSLFMPNTNAHFKKNNHASSDYIEIFVTEACTDQILLINSFQSIIAFHLKTCHALQNKWVVSIWNATLGWNGLNSLQANLTHFVSMFPFGQPFI